MSKFNPYILPNGYAYMPLKTNEHRTSWTHNTDGTLIKGMEKEYAIFLGDSCPSWLKDLIKEPKQCSFNF